MDLTYRGKRLEIADVERIPSEVAISFRYAPDETLPPGITQVSDNLWVSGWTGARDGSHCFEIIVNVAVDAPDYGSYKKGLVDGPGNPLGEMMAATDCVAGSMRAGKRTLVYCVAGKSRSVAVAAAAISGLTGEPVATALERIRPLCGCGPNQPHPSLVTLAQEAVTMFANGR